MKKKVETLYGRYVNGKMVYTTPIVNYLTGGNWKDGFSRVASGGGQKIEYEIINKEKIDMSARPDKTYKFNVVKKKAKIID